MQGNREKKLNKLLMVEVAEALKELSVSSSTLVTVLGTKISPTLEHATIIVSVFPLEKSEIVLESLNRKIYPIQQTLNKRLNLRTVPKIRFELDTTEEQAARIEELLDKDNI